VLCRNKKLAGVTCADEVLPPEGNTGMFEDLLQQAKEEPLLEEWNDTVNGAGV